MAGEEGKPGPGHNKPPVNGDEDKKLKSFFERIQRLDDEKKGISDDQKDIYLEAKAIGYDTATMRRIYRLWKMDPAARKSMMALDEMYLRALGLDLV